MNNKIKFNNNLIKISSEKVNNKKLRKTSKMRNLKEKSKMMKNFKESLMDRRLMKDNLEAISFKMKCNKNSKMMNKAIKC